MKKREPLYYIQNKGFVGNCLLWWRVNGCGYTCNLDEAWKVNKAKADEICSIRKGPDKAHLVSIVDQIAKRHVTDAHFLETPVWNAARKRSDVG